MAPQAFQTAKKIAAVWRVERNRLHPESIQERGLASDRDTHD
jgi:hypothetical protein